MAIEDIQNLNQRKLSVYESECIKQVRNAENQLIIATIYGEACQVFSATTDRNMFMDHIFTQCAKEFQWNPNKLKNIDEMKQSMYQIILATSKDPETKRPRGIIPSIASYTAPQHRADSDEPLSDLELIERNIQRDQNLLESLVNPGPAREKALAKLAENTNRRNTPEVDLQMMINARKIQLKGLQKRYSDYQELVRASGVVQGRFLLPERASKNAVVYTAKVFDDFLGKGGQSDLNELVDLEDLT